MTKSAEFERIKALFSQWVKNGVPSGVAYPKTQSEAVGWKCEPYGIVGVGSKSYFRTTHPEYGNIVKEIKELIAKLRPEGELQKRKRDDVVQEASKKPAGRIYKSQKARRITAEDLSASLTAENNSLLSQLQNVREELASTQLSLKIERQTSKQLQDDSAKLKEDNAKLTRMLAARNGILQVVE